MVKETFRKIVLIFISLFLLVSSVLAEIQFHPLSQVTPIDTNLNMNTFNITNVNYLIYNTGIIAAGIRGIPTTDIQDFAVIGSKIADRAVSASKLSNPLVGPINVNGAINASYYYDFENSSYYLDLASTGYSLLVAGSVGIGTTSPIKKLDVVGDINATAGVYGATLYEGGTALSSKYVPQSRQVLAGAGLTGGGDLSADRSFAIAFGEDFLGWRNLTNYPAGCGAGKAVQAIGDTLSCIDISGASNITGVGSIGQVAFWTGTSTLGGDNNFYWDNINKRLGIGTTSPLNKLNVVGDLNYTGNLYGTVMGSNIADNSIPSSKFTNPLAGPINIAGVVNASAYYDRDNFAYYLDPSSTGNSLLVAGNVGIGTTVPAYKLDVSGDVRWTGTLQGGSVPWARLTNFPSACPSGQFVTAVGTTLICASPPSGGIGGSGTTNYVAKFTGATTIGNFSDL
jgi:hypothetical protein